MSLQRIVGVVMIACGLGVCMFSCFMPPGIPACNTTFAAFLLGGVGAALAQEAENRSQKKSAKHRR